MYAQHAQHSMPHQHPPVHNGTMHNAPPMFSTYQYQQPPTWQTQPAGGKSNCAIHKKLRDQQYLMYVGATFAD
jgi:hypothetical protein